MVYDVLICLNKQQRQTNLVCSLHTACRHFTLSPFGPIQRKQNCVRDLAIL